MRHQFTYLFIHSAVTITVNKIVGSKTFLLDFYHVDSAIKTIFLNCFIAFGYDINFDPTRIETTRLSRVIRRRLDQPEVRPLALVHPEQTQEKGIEVTV